MYKLSAAVLVFVFFIQCGASHRAVTNPQQLKNMPVAFIGNFTDDYGSIYSISDSAWIQDKGIKYHLLQYDSIGQFFIARNAATNPSEAGLYSRIDVMRFTGMEPWQWGFCLTEYKAKTAEDAIAKQAADRANPRKGCNGYPFTRMKQAAGSNP